MFYKLAHIYTAEKKMQHPQGLSSLAPGYNMCIMKGCSVSNSFIMVIGDQMALRRPVFGLSVLTLQAVTVVLLVVKSVCNIHTRVQSCPTDEYVLPFNNFSHLNRSHCRSAGSWMDILTDFCCWAQCISGMSLLSAVVNGTFPHP